MTLMAGMTSMPGMPGWRVMDGLTGYPGMLRNVLNGW